MELSSSFADFTITPHAQEQVEKTDDGSLCLKTFDELQNWTENKTVPLSRASDVLYLRRGTSADQQDGKSNLVNQDESNEVTCPKPEEATATIPEDNLGCAKAAICYSPNLITIPSQERIEACHGDGNEVLGTFQVGTGVSQVERILESRDGYFWVARKLALIAKHFNFDGWLINPQTVFPSNVWSSSKLQQFLSQLRLELGEARKVIWCDGLTTLNSVWHQNTLNYLNLAFALAAGSFLTSQSRTTALANCGKRLAAQHSLGIENLHYLRDRTNSETQSIHTDGLEDDGWVIVSVPAT